MPPHRLDPLLKPRSLAVVGASRRPGSVGNLMIRQLLQGGYGGALHAVNPGYDSVEGVPCFATLAELPRVPEHAVFALSDDRIEGEFRSAIAQGIRAATIVSALAGETSDSVSRRDRIGEMARSAGILLCGGNGMGFYNFAAGVRVCGFQTRERHEPGGVTLISHSGSLFTALLDAEERIDYNLAVSSGQELVLTLADYMDFALEQAETRVIGLFMETARDPGGFLLALEKAAARRIPVVALKVGRSEAAVRFTETHSGALAGDDAAYQAVFEAYGVSRVTSIDELAATLIAFQSTPAIGPGGLATLHDSGGERALFADLASDAGTAMAALSPATIGRLTAALDPGLAAANPLDAWGTGRNYPDNFHACTMALAENEDTAAVALVLDRGVGGRIFSDYFDMAAHAGRASGKPVFIVSNHQGSGADPRANDSTRAGIPVLDGVPVFLRAYGHLTRWRDFVPARKVSLDPIHHEWQERLASGSPLDEAQSLGLLAAAGITIPRHRMVTSLGDTIAAAGDIGYPVVLKSAAPGLAHKSDAGGVRLGLTGEALLSEAFADIASRLGPQMIVAEMITSPAIEMLLGMIHDPDFGPIVLLGFGGIHAEILQDVQALLPPFEADQALIALQRLRLRPLLDGVRGGPAGDIQAFCTSASAFSHLVSQLGPWLDAMDVNPVLVTATGCVAVDALVKLRSSQAKSSPSVEDTSDCSHS
ncbi:acyl-CoA synthetase (NDP forming) [Rhodoligotrophos appendicifer]|uniref:acetate--CoA ligase family protein n=1 Tax=Rhodoligotrophos appendicifer TaxID=987056 RepID=UPI001180E726|nr:acetate--CoA ligase family protein [Rhodoligotrophos appendicifer]